MYVYILENYAYSDFEYYVFVHEKHYTKSEFKEIVKEAMKKVKTKRYHWNFEGELFNILREEYGFEDGDMIPTFHIDNLEKELK